MPAAVQLQVEAEAGRVLAGAGARGLRVGGESFAVRSSRAGGIHSQPAANVLGDRGRIGAPGSPNLSGTTPRFPPDPAPRGLETGNPRPRSHTRRLGDVGGASSTLPSSHWLRFGSGEPIPTGLPALLWGDFRFRFGPCPALPASLARPSQDGGVRAGALPLANCGRLRWGLYHGHHRRRYLPSGQRFSQFSSGSEPPAAREFDSHQNQGSAVGRQLCGVGRSVLHDRLQPGSGAREGGPLELHHERGLDRSHPGRQKRAGGHGGVSRDGRHPSGSHRRSWHLADAICLRTVPQWASVCGRPLPAACGAAAVLAVWRLSAVPVGLLRGLRTPVPAVSRPEVGQLRPKRPRRDISIFSI